MRYGVPVQTPVDPMLLKNEAVSKKVKTLVIDNKAEIEKAYKAMSDRSFMAFVRGLCIDGQTGKRVFEGVMAEFQRRWFEELAPSLEALRDGYMPDIRRFWLERTKKASKDADLAIVVTWLVAFPRRPFYGQIGAADRDQAAIIRDRLSALLFHNPWLNELVTIVGNEIRSAATRPDGSPLARFDIESSDVAGSHGGTPDLLIINELSHITKWEFAQTMMDNADGVAQGIVIIATNAGIKGTKAWTWRCAALTSENWCVHVLAEPAPWHSAQTIKDAERRNPRSRFLRLWRGLWVSGKGDALQQEEIEALFTMSGPDDGPLDGWTYLLGMDLGITHDHAAVMVLGVHESLRRIRTAEWRKWEPPEGGEIDLTAVENYAHDVYKKFRAIGLHYDPSQAVLMAQRLRKRGLRCREMTFSKASNLTKMAESFLQAVKGGVLHCYDDKDMQLRTDFGKFDIVEKNYGQRLEAISDETGHADVGTALLIACPAAVDLMGGVVDLFTEDDEITSEDEADLTEEEVKGLPSALRDIYEME